MGWEIDCSKYLTLEESLSLFSKLERLSRTKKMVWVKSWMLVDLLFQTGIRVRETKAIRHNDFYLDSDEPKLFISNGKGSKTRWIPLGNERLREHIKEFTRWKESVLMGTKPEDHFFMSKNQNCYSTSGLQYLAKLSLKTINLSHHSIHHFRHSFATHHYQKNKDLRGLQLILGHSSPTVTTVYADRPFKELIKSTQNLY